MKYALMGAQRQLVFDVTSWQILLTLACNYGWQPAGTESREIVGYDGLTGAEQVFRPGGETGWNGNYTDMAYQTVGEKDALDLAAAIERALPDIPDHDALAGLGAAQEYVTAEQVSPLEWWGGAKDQLRDFIRLCREGSFVIAAARLQD